MTPELQAVAAPLLAQMQKQLGNGMAGILVEMFSFAEGALPEVEFKAYHCMAGISRANHATPQEAVNELLARCGKDTLIEQAEHLRDRAEELERAANSMEETK